MCISYIHYDLKPLESVINLRKLSLLVDHLCSALHAPITAERGLSRLGRKSVICQYFLRHRHLNFTEYPMASKFPTFASSLIPKHLSGSLKNSTNCLTAHMA